MAGSPVRSGDYWVRKLVIEVGQMKQKMTFCQRNEKEVEVAIDSEILPRGRCNDWRKEGISELSADTVHKRSEKEIISSRPIERSQRDHAGSADGDLPRTGTTAG